MFIKYAPLALAAACSLSLAACATTSSLTEEQKEPVPEETAAFSGELRPVDEAQSYISFRGESNLINHEGKFNQYTAVITLDQEDPADLEKATIEAEVDITSVETDAAGLDGHLQKEDFFNTEVYPTASFVSSQIVSLGDNMYQVTGNLTMKGVTNQVTFEAEITDDYLLAQYDLVRGDFGIGNDSYGDKLLEETVPVEIKLVFTSTTMDDDSMMMDDAMMDDDSMEDDSMMEDEDNSMMMDNM